ncbi:hypothetical protein [Paracoccus siganidrum]|uniref:Uncharacterized protein n=1 Tax=Paracoccus siganidrum TaxID=1276757 RepID=A0A419A7U3_9RHOB|nr:hypothetical protein [Paracoccus siganidrum]RJL17979.1 hypothetical protein D3P05_08370 [Paracoccus siganidrum]RMC40993.1 hypothetical protein C9E82_00160 [Paracoccus siganidrum]
MSALREHIQTQQNNAAALEAVVGAMLHLIERPDETTRSLCIQMAETAFGLAQGLNHNLDTMALPKGAME